MPLNDRQIKNAKPAEKAYKISDGHGLYLLVKPNGGKYWRFKYYIDNKERLLSIGTYPTISLAEAREAAETILGMDIKYLIGSEININFTIMISKIKI